ncbi:PC-Esterase domain-containing protein/PMR5N domain-containing protein [Cephalotus follicularis]|uniref:PC-Esterase domain-containing protein/PMR5N domain-containing protein n=1 Tax=Cephalotus follicularis TaxID=3775 RepID=A0A1Q3C9T5_CEPFO|nr:PC-Esterase domain-containing protein/PMR5N domain-containing protein [Cephalotus follicularis]
MMQRCNRRKTHFPLLAFLFLAFILFSIFYNERSIQRIHQDQDRVPKSSFTYIKPNLPRHPKRAPKVLDRFSTCNSTREYSGRKIGWVDPEAEACRRRETLLLEESCDLFSGKWVFDNKAYPLYNESSCPYMSDQLACHKHGRSDLGYQHWRWQPHNCNLKRWNVTEMWEKLRGKRLMFVGDSLNRGQWISMVCLLQSVIAANKRSMSPNAELTIFRAEEYNATVEFLWAPLLVESNSDDPVNHRLDERILRPDSVLRHSARWEHADILVFNTYLWWRQGPVKLLWSDEQNGVCEHLDGLGAMELAMGAWADWVAAEVNPLKKLVFFVTMSPTHLWSREWETGSEGNCYNEKTPIDFDVYWGSGSDLPTMRMVEKVLNRLSSKVSVINITQLSEYRKDGHPSIYRKFWETLSPEKLSNPSSYSDCIHWCLPGVPDVWNELLFHLL